MTKAEAKALSLEVWGYLAEHPECERKRDMPDAILEKFKGFIFCCPLCWLYNQYYCNGCILDEAGENCHQPGSAYIEWEYTESGEAGNETRKAAAKRIYEIIQTMETGEDE